MTELDQALVALRQNVADAKSQSRFYDLFLNATFFVPSLEVPPPDGSDAAVAETEVLPLIIEVEGNDYLMLFDTRERLNAWAQAEAPCVEVPGHVIAATTMPPLHWALNVGTEHSRKFLPDEITWLKEVVDRCIADAAVANTPPPK